MKGLIFSEGNGYGHVARDCILSEHFNFPIMTFGKGAGYCKKNSIDFIEIPSPYRILSEKGKVKIATDYSGLIGLFQPDVLSQMGEQFGKMDMVIVDGAYPERVNNALQLEKNNVGIMLEKRLLSAESLSASAHYAKTLDRARLEIYKKYAQKSEPLTIIEKCLQG